MHISRAFIVLATIGLLVVLATASTMTQGAEAAQITLPVAGTGLDLDLEQEPTITAVSLTGLDQVTTGTLGLLEVRDGRGNGLGWNLVAEATDFVNISDPSITIDAGGLVVPTDPVVTTAAGNAAPESYAGPLDAPLKILSAQPDTGMGRYLVEPPLELLVPAEVLGGTYESTVYVTVTSGP